MWTPFCILSQEMRHINLFLGAQSVYWVGHEKCMLNSACAFSVEYTPESHRLGTVVAKMITPQKSIDFKK